jgi:hypothetical protein
MEDVMSESQKAREHYKNTDIGGRKILKRILKEKGGVVWCQFIWPRAGTSERFLRMQY